ncbi:MAG: AraC family transcriptional regulator [Lentisphaerae bacterium]|jgi:AraC-like DNA-binding protein|nr:AraC family transcriptional regulator [Lentisphaerota bacterium]MBT4823263.1 AraC family transcriptional regulator [Lentisphaerota bacterium]MBT5609171.1 AraC family transcriptional regulator [Lentisphaerota bacterium]MBT7053625.1 AraC family transcriptional regulator [Lentisphaerota bacterium]MBT7845716.1 AraC family transcriptional regulator [Lentisphaerota bacterium]
MPLEPPTERERDRYEEWLTYFFDFRRRVRFLAVGSFLHQVPWVGTRRTYQFYACIFIEAGKMTIDLDGNDRLLTAGTLALIPPGNEFHLYNREPTAHCLNYRIYLNTIDRRDDQILIRPMVFDGCPGLIHSVKQVYLIDKTRGRHWEQRMRALLINTFIFAAEEQETGRNAVRRFNQSEQAKIMACIEDGIHGELRAGTLADKLNLSHAYFSKIFRNTYGVAPQSFILNQRLERAAVLLKETDVPICRICEDVGFGNEGFYFRAFKQRYGMTPRKYRDSKTQHFFSG